MTYLEAVNNILLRLRERRVSSVSESDYSQLIGLLINDAKSEVENSWDWSALRTTLSGDTTAGLFSYELNGASNNFTLLDVFDDTSNTKLEYMPQKWFNEQYLLKDQIFGPPKYYGFNSNSLADVDTQVDIYPVPDGVYSLRFNIVDRQGELADDGVSLRIPSRPVLLLAYAKAIEERGEDAGVLSSSAYAAAKKSLEDAIMFDVSKHPEEMIYYTV
jgi:hypothetical protein